MRRAQTGSLSGQHVGARPSGVFDEEDKKTLVGATGPARSGGGSFCSWASAAATPMPEALIVLESGALVHIETAPWLVFRPVDRDPTVGLILYPGGRVDSRAYAPIARALAEEGHLVVIVPMPLNLAFFAPGRTAQVMTAFPGIESWAVGAHSLGGAMAANFAHRNPEAVRGLVLWAAYPAASDDLSDYQLAAVSIYGTRDGLATPVKIDASRPFAAVAYGVDCH